MNFSPDFTSAETVDGRKLRFTRSESTALLFFSQNPNRLVTRAQLLDAVSGDGSDKNDRNVDFLINRLRQKLSDSAKDPQYIATRYGEGYVWVAGQASAYTKYGEKPVFLVLGPVRNATKSRYDSHAKPLLKALQTSCKRLLGSEHTVVIDPNCPEPTKFQKEIPRFSAEFSFFDQGPDLQCVLSFREFRSGRVLSLHRFIVPPPDLPSLDINDLAREVLDKALVVSAMDPETMAPLPVALVEAAGLTPQEAGKLGDTDAQLRDLADQHKNKTISAWKYGERRLRTMSEADPGNIDLRVAWATHIHSKYVTHGRHLFSKGVDTRKRDEDLIEELILHRISDIQKSPENAIAAAKLLYF